MAQGSSDPLICAWTSPHHLSTTATMYHMHSTFSVGCKIQHTVTHSIRFGLFSAGDTRPPGILLRSLLMPMPISRCCHASLSLYFSFLSHAARITQVHLVTDPTLRIQSVDVRLIRSPATPPHAVMAQVTMVTCVYIRCSGQKT